MGCVRVAPGRSKRIKKRIIPCDGKPQSGLALEGKFQRGTESECPGGWGGGGGGGIGYLKNTGGTENNDRLGEIEQPNTTLR